MSVAPNVGIVEFGVFKAPDAGLDGVQGQVPGPTLAEAGYVLSTTGWVPGGGGGGGSGTVTSVGLSLPSIFTVTGTPVTTSGTLTGSLATQSANTVFVAPDATSGAPTFRSLLANDIPNLDASKITSGTLNSARLPSTADTNARVAVENNGTLVGTRRSLNFIAGSNVTLTITDDSANEEVDITIASTGGGGGGVSSVDVSGGTTGFSFSGGPITSSGTITMSGTLDLDNGGTGATTAANARTNLDAQKTITSGTAAPSGGSDGDIYLQYV
jgi:hypothetical protein